MHANTEISITPHLGPIQLIQRANRVHLCRTVSAMAIQQHSNDISAHCIAQLHNRGCYPLKHVAFQGTAGRCTSCVLLGMAPQPWRRALEGPGMCEESWVKRAGLPC
jgi:hypothetical protein